ncbi:MAG: hypothetical protein WAM14_08595 [Candidatus Nitrosopolaris sp.]
MQLIVKALKRLRKLLPKIKIDNDDDGDEDVHEVHDNNEDDGEKRMMQESASIENKGYAQE